MTQTTPTQWVPHRKLEDKLRQFIIAYVLLCVVFHAGFEWKLLGEPSQDGGLIEFFGSVFASVMGSLIGVVVNVLRVMLEVFAAMIFRHFYFRSITSEAEKPMLRRWMIRILVLCFLISLLVSSLELRAVTLFNVFGQMVFPLLTAGFFLPRLKQTGSMEEQPEYIDV